MGLGLILVGAAVVLWVASLPAIFILDNVTFKTALTNYDSDTFLQAESIISNFTSEQMSRVNEMRAHLKPDIELLKQALKTCKNETTMDRFKAGYVEAQSELAATDTENVDAGIQRAAQFIATLRKLAFDTVIKC